MTRCPHCLLRLGALLGALLGAPALADDAAVAGSPRALTLPSAPGTAADRSTGSVQFIGTATVILRLGDLTLLTDPNFLHRGEQAELGYGLSSPRRTDPALPIDALPPIDAIVLSHFHGDHFDQVAQARLDKRIPIVTTPAAAAALRDVGFGATQALAPWQALELRKGTTRLRITAMPARHGPPVLHHALPDTMGSLLEWLPAQGSAEASWRLYISGDTLVFDALAEIPRRYPQIDLALLHLGGTRVFGVLVTMDAEQGVQALRLIAPQRAIPIHYDDYPVFRSPLEDFVTAARRAGLEGKLQMLQRGEHHRFALPGPPR